LGEYERTEVRHGFAAVLREKGCSLRRSWCRIGYWGNDPSSGRSLNAVLRQIERPAKIAANTSIPT
jgi:hypothetical protein